MSELIRKNIRMSKKVAQWYESKASELGVSQANLMVIALSQYMDQQKTIDMMPTYKEILKKIEMPHEG